MEKLLTIGEVSRVLNVPIYRAYELARQGRLPIVRLGKQLRVEPETLRRWMADGGSALEDK